MIVEEKTISSDRIYTGKVISLKVDTVEIENKGYTNINEVNRQINNSNLFSFANLYIDFPFF